MAADAVRFLLNDRLVEVADLPATTTLLEYLREHAGCTGTKEGCAEGDCGACTVVLGSLTEEGAIRYRAVNSCIRFLPTVDAHAVVTVEDLASPDGSLHPVQQAMVDEHASQCGFCTPGFVMSLFAHYLDQPAPTREGVVEALSGNLCRCTGYRPIIDAGLHMSKYPTPARWSRSDAQSAARCSQLEALRRSRSLRVTGFVAPRTLDELAAELVRAPESLILAGATDIGLWSTKQLRELPPLVYLGEVAELKVIRESKDALVIGAAVSLTDAWRAVVAAYPSIQEIARRFASPPVCNAGTLCGNLANGSPIGDSMPILMALGAELELRKGTQVRRVPLDRFYLGYQRTDRAPGEFIVSVTVSRPTPGVHVASYKVSKRFDQDISAVCTGFAVEVVDGVVKAARIAYGGMAAIPARAPGVEAALIGRPWTERTVDAAAKAIDSDFKPLTDLRGTSDYRLRAARNLLRRFFQSTTGSATVLRTADVAAVVE